VLIQNGFQIEEEYKSAYPNNTLLSCVVYLPSTQISPGVVEMGNMALLEIGPYPALSSPSAASTPSIEDLAPSDPVAATTLRLRDLVRAGGGTSHCFADVQSQRWKKLILNCGCNPVCALSRSRDVAVLSSCDEAEDYVRQVMLEVAGVAQAEGYRGVNAEMVEEQMERAIVRIGTKGIEPSMMADVGLGRRLEVEAILGGVVRLGKKRGCGVVRLEGLYVLAKALDDRIGAGELKV